MLHLLVQLLLIFPLVLSGQRRRRFGRQLAALAQRPARGLQRAYQPGQQVMSMGGYT